ncbi:MAG: DUF1080 domain-containing protein [Bacteroidia bacterium]|nr:DUF1080 domain-containing protein [Bacteroidia bacterium]
MKQIIGVMLLFCLPLSIVFAQNSLPLEDLSGWQDQAGNWRIVGKVMPTNPKKKEPIQATSSKKKKRKKKKGAKVEDSSPVMASSEQLFQAYMDQRSLENNKEHEHAHGESLNFQAGQGILLNINNDSMKSPLLSSWEHGDLELSCEVLLPKGSNSGIYLHGRYEVQLFDSWGVGNPSFSDMGGIFRNWSNTPGNIYRGKAPNSNPSKAPGLWQKLHLLFQAPRFDENGKKIKNAKLVFVDLNGVRIHQNVEIPLPTGGPISNKEVPKGPLMIQGDHGAVAFRNITYTDLKETQVSVKDVSYDVFEGEFLLIEDYEKLAPVRSGKSALIDGSLSGLEDNFGMVIQGNLLVEEARDYRLYFMQRGGALLEIDGKAVVDYQKRDAWDNTSINIRLEKGEHPFKIYYYKSTGWMPTGLGLRIKASDTYEKSLHSYDSYPTKNRMVSPIHVESGSDNRILRGFLDFNGDRKQRLTHTIAVGSPTGVHYIFDPKTAHVVCAWKGDFVDATPMWHDRGDGSFRPRGAALYTFSGPALALTSTDEESPGFDYYPADFKSMGYTYLPSKQGIRFDFSLDGKKGNVQVKAYDGFHSLIYKVELAETNPRKSAFYKIAEGKNIEFLDSGMYAVDDFSYFIRIVNQEHAKGFIKKVDGKYILYAPLKNGKLYFDQIW